MSPLKNAFRTIKDIKKESLNKLAFSFQKSQKETTQSQVSQNSSNNHKCPQPRQEWGELATSRAFNFPPLFVSTMETIPPRTKAMRQQA